MEQLESSWLVATTLSSNPRLCTPCQDLSVLRVLSMTQRGESVVMKPVLLKAPETSSLKVVSNFDLLEETVAFLILGLISRSTAE